MAAPVASNRGHPHWTASQYEAIVTSVLCGPNVPEQFFRPDAHVAGIDFGEVHMAVSHDGERTHILNGRLLRHKRQYQNKLKEHLSKRIDRTKKASRRRTKLVAFKKKPLRKIKYQIKAIEHQHTTTRITTLAQEGVQIVVIGDVKDIRKRLDVGSKTRRCLRERLIVASETPNPFTISSRGWP